MRSAEFCAPQSLIITSAAAPTLAKDALRLSKMNSSSQPGKCIEQIAGPEAPREIMYPHGAAHSNCATAESMAPTRSNSSKLERLSPSPMKLRTTSGADSRCWRKKLKQSTSSACPSTSAKTGSNASNPSCQWLEACGCVMLITPKIKLDRFPMYCCVCEDCQMRSLALAD